MSIHASFGSRRRALSALVAAALASSLAGVGCTTPAEFRKLQNRVTDIERGTGKAGGTGERTRIADIGAQLDEIRRAIQELQGRVEVVEHRTQEALDEARSARSDAARPDGTPADAATGPDAADTSQEMKDYRAAYSEWRADNAPACIDHFSKFLQTYPTSDHADDATYWLADCYFKQGNYSAAVLRFDDVARQYPKGSKAADALYRQGEALLRMGHSKAASNAFEKVLRDYPGSARAPEAKRQLQLLGAG
jgi:tol-pal system protein YbgF